MPALSGSRAAQVAFHRIEVRFGELPPDRRVLVEDDLRAFLAAHPGDGHARVVRVYLAWIEIERRRFTAAQELLDGARRGPPGAPRDLAEVGHAAILRRQGHPGQALALLEPLRGKLADPTDRGLFSGEFVRALLDAGRSNDALLAMLDWAEQATPTERDAIVSSVEVLVRAMPTRALEAGHRALAQGAGGRPLGGRSARAEAERWLRGLMASTLTRTALTTRDAELARRLLQGGYQRLSRDSSYAALVNLAGESPATARVLGRSLGLVLELSDEVARRRSAEVALGMTRALGLPESADGPSGVRLLTRDAAEPGELERALSGLAGDGVTLLVAGVTDEGALAASLFAERTRTPVIVLRPLPSRAPSPYAFVLGVDSATEERGLASVMGRASVHAPVRVGPGGTPCDAEPTSALGSRFPIETWKRVRADAVVVTGDARCAQEVAAEAGEFGWQPFFVLGLEAAEAAASLPAGSVATVGAGRFPSPGFPVDGGERAFLARFAGPPSWYAVLGRDAALLSASALASLPEEDVDDALSVERRHVRAREALLRVRAPLWSTTATGFAGANSIERTLVVSEPARRGGAAP